MIEESALVVGLAKGFVWVETQRSSTCGACTANKGCGIATLSRVLGKKRNRVKTLNPEMKKVSVGDEVIIGIDEQALVRGSLAIYTAPLIAMFGFGILGQTLAEQFAASYPDIIVTIFSLSGLFVGFLWVKSFARKIRSDVRFQPVLLRRVLPSVFKDISVEY